jgi:hypothetical protein
VPELYYSSGGSRWAFGRHNDDTTGAAFTSAYGGTPVTGQWTHLVGVYNGQTNEISLYVNGTRAATTTFAGTPWNATGPVQIGRRLYEGSYGEYANAQISDVQTYDTALSPTAINTLDTGGPLTPYQQLG